MGTPSRSPVKSDRHHDAKLGQSNHWDPIKVTCHTLCDEALCCIGLTIASGIGSSSHRVIECWRGRRQRR